jgi:hypothetical protein
MVDDSNQHIMEVSVQNLMQLGGLADFLCAFIRSLVSGLMQFHDMSDEGK